MYDNKAVSERILTLMKSKGMTKYKLSVESGVSETNLNSYFNRDSKWSIENLMKIADYFNVSLDYLARGETKDFTKDYVKIIAEKDAEILKLKKDKLTLAETIKKL